MSALRFFLVSSDISGLDDLGWTHSRQNKTIIVGAKDASGAAREVADIVTMPASWLVKHVHAHVLPMRADGKPVEGAEGTWVRVTYTMGGIYTITGQTYADIKRMEGQP